MTNEQLVKEIQQGINRIKNLEILYTKNIGFIRQTIYRTLKRKNIQSYIFDDLMQVSFLALEKATIKFNFDKDVLFISYLEKYIRGYILRYGCPQTGYYDDVVSMDSPLNINEDLTLADTIQDETITPFEDVAVDIDLKNRVWSICKDKLTEKENKVIVNKFKYKRTLTSIADEEGCTYENIRQYIYKGLRKLRKNKDIIQIGRDCGYLCYRNVGLNEFNRTWTSSVEWAVLQSLDID